MNRWEWECYQGLIHNRKLEAIQISDNIEKICIVAYSYVEYYAAIKKSKFATHNNRDETHRHDAE